ncbi:MAG TPA: TIGR01906 family membrane protein [Clostridiales bacterium]|nr:TIGR01906 family membrane protein [Clostridiales bacterium]
MKVGILLNVCKGMLMIVIPLAVLLSILEIYVFCPEFYKQEFQKQNAVEKIGIQESDLDRIVHKMFRYLKNKDADMNIQVSIQGKQVEAFGDREKRHMRDVKDLFQKGFFIRNAAALIGIFLFFLLWRISPDIRRDILQSCIGASFIAVLTVILLIAAVYSDFYTYFVYFHEIFFSNDMWILDPQRDLLIQLLPLTFFMNITIRIVGWFGGLMSILGFLSYWLWLRRKRAKPS